jgi:thymidylate synthase (FAD)
MYLSKVMGTFAMIGVSRVFTHELCRHRLANISQESLRYVRLTDLGAYYPQSFDDIEDETTRNKANDIFNKAFEQDEENITELSKLFNLEDEANFSAKKKLTSAMRRLAPMGLTTNIIFTSNQRNFRHMIGLRTSSGAEEEIRQVFALIAETLENMYPSMYQDMKPRPGDFGFPEYFFANEKV